MPRRILLLLLSLFITLLAAPLTALAEESSETSMYYLGDVVNAGLDTGFSENNKIGQDDPHFGWSLGQFFVSGYTSVEQSPEGYPVFLKTAGDKVRLSFRLEQDINALNGNASLSVNEDTNGSDTAFGIPKTNFGRGTLIVRQTNYQNETMEPQIYTDYLVGIEQGADTEVQLFEEGEYEVFLYFEIKDDPRRLGPISIAPGYSNYKISFRFAVRNGNCIVFPFDAQTHSELTNESYAPNGFYLDLAKSRYLDVYIKREVMAAGADGLVEDVRFNGPARDGDMYTEDGVYTITASNEYTGQSTVKTIYVGDDPVLKTYAVTGLSIPEINQRIAAGEVIAEDGKLVLPETNSDQLKTGGDNSRNEAPSEGTFWYIAVPCLLVAAFIAVLIARSKTSRKIAALPSPETDDSLVKNENDEVSR